MAHAIENVQSNHFSCNGFTLSSGEVLPNLLIAYETYGQLAADRSNVVLVTHGFTSSHHAAGRYAQGQAPKGLADADQGSWDKLIGPAKPIDTDRLFVVSSNMLGSSYGSTSPASIDPRTGQPYGPDFPRFNVSDIVAAQKALLDSLGVEHLVAVAGPSYGGFQAFQWAVSYPNFMDGIVAVVTAPSSRTTAADTQKLVNQLATDPNWNGGRYYHKGGIKAVMSQIRVATLKNYGIEEQLTASYPDPNEREAAIKKAVQPWAEAFDGNSMVALRRALEGFDTTKDFAKIKARVLYVISRTDKLFPPSIAPQIMKNLEAAGVNSRYFEIDTELGHLASGPEGRKWGPVLRDFMTQLTPRT